MVSVDFHSMEKTYLEVIGYNCQLFGYSNLQNILFCVQ